MPGRYEPDMRNATFGFPVLPKDSYLLEVSQDPKAFERDGKKGTNYGVRLVCKILEATDKSEMVGKTCTLNLYYHTPESVNFSKGIVAAFFGSTTDEEFNSSKVADADFGFNTIDGSCGEGWHELKKCLIRIDCDDPQVPKESTDGKEQTKIVKYYPAN